MREKLKQIRRQRKRFCAVFVRYGSKTGYNGAQETTLLFRDVRMVESGEVVSDHIWFTMTKGFRSLGALQAGDVVCFDACVKQYRKGYWGYDPNRQIEHPPGFDYKLSYPTKIEKTGERREASDGA